MIGSFALSNVSNDNIDNSMASATTVWEICYDGVNRASILGLGPRARGRFDMVLTSYLLTKLFNRPGFQDANLEISHVLVDRSLYG